MHVQSPIFHGQLKEKKRINDFNSLGAREGGKECLKKDKKCIFQGLFKNIDM